ncbi:hypothetical protein BAE44_0014631 [Dichanthelium oligosanthes]|uniref:Uncharacterized protein n=1 Tax=Dichanthelium oligosanthes TaxID=888268 RepID=A0A1E5VGV9_9POAL|nr:hypothetical protein BAE44_0014631 [Dichanthelium oligosanthes]
MSLVVAAAARSTGGCYACVLPAEGDSVPTVVAYAGVGPQEDELAEPSPSPTVVASDADEAMARLEGVDLLVIDALRHDAAAVLRAARPGTRGMVVVRQSPRRREAAWRHGVHGRRDQGRALRLPSHRRRPEASAAGQASGSARQRSGGAVAVHLELILARVLNNALSLIKTGAVGSSPINH